MLDSYLLLKSLHIFGVILLLGNIIVTAWWKIMADRTRDPKIISFAQRQVTLTDFVFTVIGAVIIIFTGDYMAYGFMSDTWTIRWLTWGRLLFMLAGVIWIVKLIPIQVKQVRMARTFTDNGEIPDEYWILSKTWQLYGAIAVVLPVINIFWMVFKPT